MGKGATLLKGRGMTVSLKQKKKKKSVTSIRKGSSLGIRSTCPDRECDGANGKGKS